LAKKSKEALIKDEEARLSAIFSEIESDKTAVCAELIRNAAFMSVSLRDLQEKLNEGGYVETYQNGPNQSGTRISPAAQIYSKLIANYNAVIKALVALLPAGERDAARAESDPMAVFLASK